MPRTCLICRKEVESDRLEFARGYLEIDGWVHDVCLVDWIRENKRLRLMRRARRWRRLKTFLLWLVGL